MDGSIQPSFNNYYISWLIKSYSTSANLYYFLCTGTIFSEISSILCVTTSVKPKSCYSDEKHYINFKSNFLNFSLLSSDIVYTL